VSEHPRPALTADVVALAFDAGELRVLLVRRGHEPFAGKWALPGGFVEPGESVATAAARELREETGLSGVRLEELCTLSEPGRDPRGWVVSVAHLALVRAGEHTPRAGDDARAAEWVPVAKAVDLAFDHAHALSRALEKIRARARFFPFGAELLPEKLTLFELARLHEAVLGKKLDPRNFRRRVLQWPCLVPLDEKERGVAHRAARYYRFDLRRYGRFAREETGEP
jgi:8-oxo-dGTP diphosphatase